MHNVTNLSHKFCHWILKNVAVELNVEFYRITQYTVSHLAIGLATVTYLLGIYMNIHEKACQSLATVIPSLSLYQPKPVRQSMNPAQML